MSRQPKVAIVHDWLVGGGAERVVEQLHKLYPEAPIYTSYCTPEWRKKLGGKVVTGFLQYWPFSSLRRIAVISSILRIYWFNSINLKGFDIVISSKGNGEANDLNVPKGTTHICYCHAPTHYYWRSYQKYLKNPGFGPLNWAAKIGLRFFVGPFRKRDYYTAQKPDYFIANSSFIAKEIKKYYSRDSVVINPPLDVARFKHDFKTKREGFITVGRQVLYKHTDILVEACTKLGLPLTVIGNGPEHDRLKKLAGPTIRFPENVSDSEVINYLARSKAFLFAAIEDFGIAPLEGICSGTPVIAYREGGAVDYVKPGKTGLFFEEQTAQSLAKVLQDFDTHKFDHREIAKFAEQFSEEHFRERISAFVDKLKQ
jgi:glycosyltransferase involved in cell wall biosynthesis